MDAVDLDDIVGAGIFRELECEEKVVFECKVFTILEEKKHRKRLIIEPRDLNEHFVFDKTKLPDIHDMIELVRSGNILGQWDLACWFYQIPLDKSIQRFFGANINGSMYCLTCLPMGFVASVYVAQHLTLAATAIIPNRYVYIDNIFASFKSMEEALDTGNRLDAALEAPMVALKDSATEYGPVLEIIGIKCNAKDKTISLASHFVENHKELLSSIIYYDRVITSVRKIMKIIGIMFRGVYVLQLGFRNYGSILRTASMIAQHKR